MAFDSKKTILLEKTYLYVRASLGFQLEGTSTEKIPTNNGFYRFFVDNLQKAIGNSYVNILYDSQDLTLQCFCSDLYMDELMSSDSSAIEDVVEELKKNTTTIVEFETGVSSALASNHEDNVALNAKVEEFETGVSSALAANHLDNVAIKSSISNINFLSLLSLKSLSDSPLSFTGSDGTPNALFYFETDMNDLMPYTDSLGYFTLHKTYDCYRSIFDKSIIVYLSVNSFLRFSKFKPDYYSFDVVYFDDDFNLKNSHYSNRCGLTGDNEIVFTSSRISGIVLRIDVSIHFKSTFLNLVSSFCGKDSFCRNSFNNNALVLYPVNNLSSCLFQNFNYDFTGGYLDFRFYSSLPLDFLKSLDFVFLTDVGKFTFSGSSMGLSKSLYDQDLVVCSNFPNFVNPQAFTISKLIGISVSKSDGIL